MRPIGTALWRASISAARSLLPTVFASRVSTSGVCISPGTTVFTRMPCLAYAPAVERDNWITPAFDAL